VTERVAEEHVVPVNLLPTAKLIANVPVDDPDAAACYRLNEHAARDLAGFISAGGIDTHRRDYFLEGFAAE
jgi:hypothetical protein